MEAVLNKIMNFKVNKKAKRSLRELALRGLAGFFVLMIVFTMLSRAADAMTIAQIKTKTADKRTIDRTIKANGTFLENKEQAVSVLENLKIKLVNVSKGSSVSAGDVLMELDLEALQDKIEELEKEIREMELEASDKEYNSSLADQEQQKSLNQAKADYDRAVSKGNKAVTKAYNAMIEAYDKWQEVKNSGGGSVDGGQVSETLWGTYENALTAVDQAKEELRSKEEELEREIAKRQDEADAESEEGLSNTELMEIQKETEKEYEAVLAQAEADIVTAGKKADEALAAYEQYQNQLAEQAADNQAEAAAALEETYKAKKEEYDNAVDSMDDAKYDNSKSIKNAQKESEADSSTEIAQMKLDTKKKDLEKLQTLMKQEGKIYAPTDAVITEVSVTTGDFTPSAKSFLMADITEGIRFVAQISKEEQKYVSAGDEVTLTLNNNKDLEKLVVDSVMRNEDDPETYDVTVIVDGSTEVSIGETAALKVISKSNVYDTCVPLEALREDNNQKYLLVLRESESVLGSELSVERVDVTVLEKNNTYAALQQGVLLPDQKFVVSSNKEIQEGDRVRLEEE